MYFVFGIVAFNLVLALTAGLISVGVFRRVSGRLAISWRYLLIAFLVLALAEVLGVASSGVDLLSHSKGLIVSLFFQSAHLVFIVLAFAGLWHQFKLLKRLTGGEDD
ncbi:MAG: hypothetical protein ACYC1U_09270 [Candidatus Aquicultorales bacterium]